MSKGFKAITLAAQLYEKVKSKAQKEKKSIAAYATEILTCYMEVDERLSRYAPLVSIVGLERDCILLRDEKIERIVDVYLRAKDVFCAYDSSLDCMHVNFCLALPQIRRIVRG